MSQIPIQPSDESDASPGGFDIGPKQTNSALHQAARHGQNYLVRNLLEQGHNPNARDDDGQTPLQNAAWNGHRVCVRSLLENGANVNHGGGPYGSTLEISSRRGHADIVRMLLERGATAKEPALYEAACGGHEAIVDMLIKARANVRYTSSSGYTILHSATSSGNSSVLKRVLKAGGVEDIENQENDSQGTPLLFAVIFGHSDAFQVLLEKGADPHASGGHDDRSVLHAACAGGSAIIVRSLLSKGFDCNADGGRLGSPLHLACLKGRKAVVDVLLEHNADVEFKGGLDETALVAAVEKGHFDIAQRLIECGAEINGAEKQCRTLLHQASGQGNVTLVHLLLEKGMDPDIAVDYTGSTPLFSAVNGRLEIYSARPGDFSISPSYWKGYVWGHGHLAVVKLLLEKGVCLESEAHPLTFGQTALNKALDNEIHLENEYHLASLSGGRRPAYEASRETLRGIIRLLLENGANAEQRDTADDYGLESSTSPSIFVNCPSSSSSTRSAISPTITTLASKSYERRPSYCTVSHRGDRKHSPPAYVACSSHPGFSS